MKKRKIHILLSDFRDRGSKIIAAMTGCSYPHASIGLEEYMNTFYSFVTKGFIVESITRYVKPGREPYPCELYSLEVSDRVYMRIKAILTYFVKFKPYMHYSKLGVAFSLLHIPYIPSPLGFFCSHFVAHVLEGSGAVTLRKSSRKYFSGDLRLLPKMKLCYKGNMKNMVECFGIVAKPAII